MHKIIKILIIVTIVCIVFQNLIDDNNDENKETTENNNANTSGSDENNNIPETWEYDQIIDVDSCSTKGNRKKNVVVDVGYDTESINREYYALTNEYGQVVEVYAEEITLQDDEKEEVSDEGRYCNDEAKVPGVESSDLDEGHIIADSLGGVSNSYNITPQNSDLNRYGDQAEMESIIRESEDTKEFYAIIEYRNIHTQIPSKYSYTFMADGKNYEYEFKNQ